MTTEHEFRERAYARQQSPTECVECHGTALDEYGDCAECAAHERGEYCDGCGLRVCRCATDAELTAEAAAALARYERAFGPGWLDAPAVPREMRPTVRVRPAKGIDT